MNISLPPFIGFIRELLIFISYFYSDLFFLFFVILIVILTSYYSIMLFMYIVTGVDRDLVSSEELFVRENLIIFIHSFFIFVRLF